jgi:NAD(P)-dependent dehydrogenase (short-subunit alcohol dehydrogenase family)
MEGMKAIKGQTALITGGAKRLGRALALALGKAGVHVVVHYHRSRQAAEQLKQDLKATGVSCTLLRTDLSDSEQVPDLFHRAVVQTGPIDILINNASIFQTETLRDTTPTSIETNMQIHAVAPLELARCLAQQKRPAQVLNLLDTRVVCRDPQHIPYHLSKRTLLTLTRLLAEELAPLVQVNAVAPGLILPPEGEDDSYLEALAHTNALHRHGRPEDISEAALFLLQSEFITGQVIFVDGGHHMKGRLYE